jgi:signal peptidase II
MRRWPFALAAAVIVADRVSKRIIEAHVSDWEIIRVIPGLFQIVHARNAGIAFGIFSEQGSGGGRLLLVAFSLAVMALVGNLLWGACRNAKEHWTLAAALALVLGGAAGNLYDRVVFGSVTDFLDFYWQAHHFPVFNLADSAITIGAGLLLVNLWAVRQR